MVQYHELTDYSNIFKHCYWGRFRYHDKSNIDDNVTNRNLFISELDIKRYNKRPPQYVRKQTSYNLSDAFDHVEYYLSNDNEHVVITSPYGTTNDVKHAYLFFNGWVEIKPLYNNSARTFMKIIKK